MNIILVNTQSISFGNGLASVNRLISYTKGLIKNGHNVHIFSTGAGSPEWQDYEGVPVKHLGKNDSRAFFTLIALSYRLLKALSDVEKDCVLLVTDNYFLTVLLGVYCKLNKTKIVLEVNEYPFVLMSTNKLKKIVAPFLVNTAYKFLDGIIVISKPLMDFYKQKARKHCSIIEVPMTVETERFENVKKEMDLTYGDYVAYCGSMVGNKDGVANLLEAFSFVEKKGYPINLLLIGGAPKQSDFENLLAINKRLGNQRVYFYGRADRSEIPQLLKNAKMLALARPSSLQSTGGFPTKLGEYLATGNPVVITSVGDIPRYLKDKDNAFLVKPDDNIAFANAICYVLDNYEDAEKVGQRGKALTETTFNGEYQSVRMADFLKQVISKV